jgi:hypothetical protein
MVMPVPSGMVGPDLLFSGFQSDAKKPKGQDRTGLEHRATGAPPALRSCARLIRG